MYYLIYTLDRFMEDYKEDGVCPEGCGYWARAAAALMDALEVVNIATGNQVEFSNEKLKNMGRFMCDSRICGEYYMNFADCAAICKPEPARIFGYGKTMHDEQMMAEGAAIKKNRNEPIYYVRWYSMGRVFAEIMHYDEMKHYTKEPQCRESVWWADAQIMIARESSQRDRGYALVAQGGNNGVSHNHNDVGSFILYDNGKPLFIDIGVERYTAKTFSPQRYEIWTMRSAYHNLPQIGGAEQLPGEEYCARQAKYEEAQGVCRLSMEIGGAYGSEAGIRSWNRSYVLDRNRSAVQICDSYDLESEKTLEFHFMSQMKPEICGNMVKIGKSVMEIGDASAEATVEEIQVTDVQLQADWGDTVYRITVTTKGQKGEVCFEIKR